jgi:hypothetical protein
MKHEKGTPITAAESRSGGIKGVAHNRRGVKAPSFEFFNITKTLERREASRGSRGRQ